MKCVSITGHKGPCTNCFRLNITCQPPNGDVLDLSAPNAAADKQFHQAPLYPNGPTNETFITYGATVSKENFCSTDLHQLFTFQEQSDTKPCLREMDGPIEIPGSCGHPPCVTLNIDLVPQADLVNLRSAAPQSFQNALQFSDSARTEQCLAGGNAISQSGTFTGLPHNFYELSPSISFEPMTGIREDYGKCRTETNKKVQQLAPTTVDSPEKQTCLGCQRDRKTCESGKSGLFPCLRCFDVQRECIPALRWIQENPSRALSS